MNSTRCHHHFRQLWAALYKSSLTFDMNSQDHPRLIMNRRPRLNYACSRYVVFHLQYYELQSFTLTYPQTFSFRFQFEISSIQLLNPDLLTETCHACQFNKQQQHNLLILKGVAFIKLSGRQGGGGRTSHSDLYFVHFERVG